jgi:2-keto-4-pentenoate hydratase/2-oxohepta-3-ene-1,7-dioic acid hydratase in catechol pathway
MTHWLRFDHDNQTKIGTLTGEVIQIHGGDLFDGPTDTGETVHLGEISLKTPCDPTKVIALWNNSKANAEKQNLEKPDYPLIFLKAPHTYIAAGETIRKPAGYDGRVIFEAELGVVIGKRCKGVSLEEAGDYIFGYTCINDVTATNLLREDPTFEQWTRCKGFDTFTPMGPVIATEIPDDPIIKGVLNDRERQNYPLSDLFYGPAEVVHMLSQEMTLEAGDIISLGTSTGAVPMKPGQTIEIGIDGIGVLSNVFDE